MAVGLALTGLGAMMHAPTRAQAIHAAVSHATTHRRAITWARAVTDRDDDRYSAWLGGGDCDDSDPSAYPFSFTGNPCVELEDSPRRAPLRRADDAVRREPPRVLVLLTIDAFRCGFGDSAIERAELVDACPELEALGNAGHVDPRAHAVYPATDRSLAAIHSTAGGLLADVLGTLGYHRLMVPGSPIVVGDPESRGVYDEVFDDAHRGSSSGRATSAARVTQTVLDALRSATQAHDRVFVWAHYFDPHAPYVSDESQSLVLDSDLARYVAEVRRTDAAIGALARALRRDAALADAALVLTADHSESFGEHGDVRHGANLYESATRVPVLAWRAGSSPREGLPSVLPAGGDQIGDYLVAIATGRAFESRDETVMRVAAKGEKWGIVTEGQKLIYHRALGYLELFDLEADPLERTNLAEGRSDEVRRLLTLLHRGAALQMLALP